jgi:hypothetical protein
MIDIKRRNEDVVAKMDKNNKQKVKSMDNELDTHIVNSTKYYFNKLFNIQTFAFTFANTKYFDWDDVFGKKV